jgi:hypothetical protein
MVDRVAQAPARMRLPVESPENAHVVIHSLVVGHPELISRILLASRVRELLSVAVPHRGFLLGVINGKLSTVALP